MATMNPFDLLGDDAEDPSQLAIKITAPEKTDKSKKGGVTQSVPAKPAGKFPSKPAPPAQAVREARSDAPRGGGRGGGGRGDFNRGRGGYNRDFGGGDGPGRNNGYSGGYSKPSEEGGEVRRGGGYGGGGAPRGSSRGGGGGGGRRGGFSNEDGEGERPRRTHERRSGTGRGSDFKREGSGRRNWGTPGEGDLAAETEEVAGAETEKDVVEKPAGDDVASDANKENTAEVEEEKEPEDKEMTLDEYEKILEEKKKALQSLTTSERKVDTKEFESMQQLSNKKANDEIFIKLGSDKDKRKDALDKEEKAKKAVSINEFLKPAEGEKSYRGGRGGRGRGRGNRGDVSNVPSGGYRNEPAPAIGDAAQFPSLGGK